MVVLLTYGLCPRKKPVSHLTSAARLACSLGLCGCREQLINFTISKYHGSFLRLLIIILDVTMKKCKGRASSIKRETPATPSPEK
jgi:hypothetical protein